MEKNILAIAEEPIYPNAQPKTLIDIIIELTKHRCKVRLLQPGNTEKFEKTQSFQIITFSRTPKRLNFIFNNLSKINPPLYKAIAPWSNPKVYLTVLRNARSSTQIMCYNVQYAIPAIMAGKICRKPTLILGDIQYISYYRGTVTFPKLFLIMLLAWEKTVYYMVDRIATWGPDDKKFLIKAGIPSKKIAVIPLSIDLEKVDLASQINNNDELLKKLGKLKLKGYKILAFHGNMNYPPNKVSVNYIVNEIAPKILKEKNNVLFLIIGNCMNKNSLVNEHIIFTGFVKNIFSYLKLVDIGIIPLTSGAGIKNKVLEYFALSKAVVTSNVGIENLKVQNNKHCIIVEKENFAKTILRVIDDKEFLSEIGKNARTYVETNHSFKNYQRYTQVQKT